MSTSESQRGTGGMLGFAPQPTGACRSKALAFAGAFLLRLAMPSPDCCNECMPADVSYRLARPEDARAIGTLARRVTRRWILPEQAPGAGVKILAGMSAKAIRTMIAEGRRFHLALLDERIVGVAAMRDDSHLFQFFVSTRHQGRGIARRLWQRIMHDAVRRAGTRRFTLNSSLIAVPVYLRLGFVTNGPLSTAAEGLVTMPMRLDLR
jgi:GNAT superfamily N-acetyltransferase